jgi:hypothetical protein
VRSPPPFDRAAILEASHVSPCSAPHLDLLAYRVDFVGVALFRRNIKWIVRMKLLPAPTENDRRAKILNPLRTIFWTEKDVEERT